MWILYISCLREYSSSSSGESPSSRSNGGLVDFVEVRLEIELTGRQELAKVVVLVVGVDWLVWSSNPAMIGRWSDS